MLGSNFQLHLEDGYQLNNGAIKSVLTGKMNRLAVYSYLTRYPDGNCKVFKESFS